MRTRTILLSAVAAVILIPVAGVAIIAATIDPNDYRDRIAAELKAATGREVALAGPMKLGISLNPGLIVKDVTIGNIPGGSRPEMAKIESLEVQVSLMPLLMSRKIEVRKLIMIGPDILVESLADGRKNWQFDKPGTAQAAAAGASEPAKQASMTLPVFDAVRIERGRIAYRDAKGGQKHDLVIDTLETKLTGPNDPLPIEVKGQIDGTPLDLTGELKAISPLMANEGYVPLVLKGEAAGIKIDIDARAGLGTMLGMGEGKISLSGQSLDLLAALTGMDLPKLPPFKMAGTIKTTPDTAEFDKVTASIGSAELSVTGKLAKSGSGNSIAITAKVPEPQQLAKAFGKDVPLDQPLALTATVTGTLDKPESKDLSLTYGPASVRGPVALDLTGKDPKITTDIVATVPDGKVLTGPLKLKSDINGPVTLVAKVSGPLSALALRGIEVKLLDASLAAQGTAVVMGGAEPRFDGDVTVNAPTPAALAALGGIDLPLKQPLTFTGKVAASPASVAVSGMSLKAGPTDIKGSASAALGGARPKIVANLSAPMIDLDSLLPPGATESKGGAPAHTQASKTKVFEDTPLPLDGLKAVDADVTLAAAQIKSGELVLSDVSLAAKLANSNLSVAPLDFTIADGKVKGLVAFNGQDGQTRFQLTGKGIDTKKLLVALGQNPIIETGVDMTIDLTGKGLTAHDLVASLDGNTHIVTTRVGILNHRFIEPLSGDLAKLLIPTHSGSDQLQCFVSDTAWKDGVGSIKTLGMDSKILSVAGKGKVDLGKEVVDLRFDPRKREQSLTSLAPPVDVEGTLMQPRFKPDMGALAENVLKGGAGDVIGAAIGDKGGALGGAIGGLLGSKAGPSKSAPVKVASACAGQEMAAAPAPEQTKTETAPKAATPATPETTQPAPTTKPQSPLKGLFKLPTQ
jgi:uncharacterized protein involved in outer membrane biogenesis